ncbi:unnamed protein product [Absidia cylindrospora]
MQSASSSLLSSHDHCHHQETTSSLTSSSSIVSQSRQQQNGFQEQPIRLASMSSTSSPPLPPPLMIPTTLGENSITNSASSNDHHHHHSSQQQQYQHRHSSSSSSSPSWNLGYPPVTPPSNQQDVLMMDQSPLYDPYPSQQHQHSHHAHFRQSAMTGLPTTSSATNINTVMESTFAHRGSTSSLSLMSPQHQHQHQQLKKHLRFHIVLQATTAVTQKTEHSSLTYLNRGQSYGIQLADKLGHDGLIQSQFVIMFHDPAHRKIALNYWKFWIGQQKDPQHARAVDLDSHQSIGIMNVRYPSFDRIAFDWHGRHGAKLFVRFHCLSTDFSRIKGVKGIPLRACMSNQISTANDPLLQRHYSGSLHQPNDNKDHAELDYLEQSYCKVKLFRDKGAERKNKDDAKQLGKQFEKMMHEGDPRQHPMWLMYNESVPYSVFSETPTSPTLESFDHAMLVPGAPNNTTNAAAASSLTHPRPKQSPPKLASSFPTLSYHYQQQQQSSSSSSSSQYQQQYKHHYHPYAKRPPPPITSTTTTVPTQLYSSAGYDPLLASNTSTTTSTTSSLMTSSSSTSASSSPPLPSFVSNSHSHSSSTGGGDGNSNDSSVPSTSSSFYLPSSTSGDPDRQLKHMSTLQEQQQLYQQQAYPYHQQHHHHHHHDRFSPIPSTDDSLLTAWRRS